VWRSTHDDVAFDESDYVVPSMGMDPAEWGNEELAEDDGKLAAICHDLD
jgi:hypothetical protein